MIKEFTHVVEGKNETFCITFGDGAVNSRALVSRVESPETLVIMEASGTLAAIKAKLESTDAFLDDAIEKVKSSGLIEKAVQTGELQNGTL
ncbi:hypothetical protein [Chitinasiproducens palmae]|uniref:Uncharacterized protein n=1 Tax=Chitinasiproducens palmae TaxID=1770053 RepID=A0A1H2PSD1_9BURK|nr:hypothetical protein [Chitinasiproducens palmae]SDV49875.1 hypothetical protein SAMN05216551_109209 [Chitinasiproducens palmae]